LYRALAQLVSWPKKVKGGNRHCTYKSTAAATTTKAASEQQGNT